MKPHNCQPCKQCPFKRTSAPGYVGDASVEGFLGAVLGDAPMPCHMAVDYEAPNWREEAKNAPLCAGSLIFFANMKKRSRDNQRPRLPSSTTVFASAAEFLAHHGEDS